MISGNQLWQSLLQEAISGKLVPQLDNEPEVEQIGPAPDQDEVPFAIPTKWKWVRLCSLGDTLTGKTPPTSHPEYFGNDIPFITPGDIDTKCQVTYTNRGLAFAAKNVVKTAPACSVFMVCIGGSVGKCGMANQEIAFNQQINAIVPNKQVVWPEYLLYVLASPCFQKQVKLKAKATTVPIVNKTEWGSLLAPLPPLEEQRRIVERLNELKPLVDEFGMVQEKLNAIDRKFPQQLKQSFLQEAISGKLVPQLESEPEVEQVGPAPDKNEVPFAIPAKWKWVQIGHTFSLSSGKYLKSDFIKSDGLYPCYGANGIRGYTDTFNVSGTCNIIGRVGSCGAVHLSDGNSYVTDNAIVAKHSDVFDPHYAYFALTALNLSQYASATAQPLLNAGKIAKIYFSLPPLEEQRRIVAKIEELFAGVDKLGSLKDFA